MRFKYGAFTVILFIIGTAALAAYASVPVGGKVPPVVNDPQFVNAAGRVTRAATTDAGQIEVAPVPKATNTPILFPDGGPMTVAANTSLCAYLGANASVRLVCKTGACDYRWVTRYPDAGFPQFPDAGVALPSDNGLQADTPEQRDLAGYQWDSICAFFESAGTLSPAVAP